LISFVRGPMANRNNNRDITNKTAKQPHPVTQVLLTHDLFLLSSSIGGSFITILSIS